METFILLVWLHFIADFLFQTDEMATKKSSSLFWLTAHAVAYSAIFVMFGWKFALANGIAHWWVDGITSRINTRLLAAGKRSWFFKSIGFDQAIHITTLFLTADWLL